MNIRFDQIDKNLMYVNNIGIHIDKLKHLLITLLIFLVIFYIRKYILKNKGNLRVLSSTIRDVLVIGLFKEFIDIFGFGNPEIADFLADLFGVFVPIYIFYIFKESHKIEKTKFFRYEKFLFITLKRKLINSIKRTITIIKIRYKLLFYKHKILYTIENKVEGYLLKNSLKGLSDITVTFVKYSLIWIINLLYIMFKIPFIAFKDTISILTKSFMYLFSKINFRVL